VSQASNPLRELPSIDRLLNHPRTINLQTQFSREHLARECRRILDDIRAAVRDGESVEGTMGETAIVDSLERRLAAGHAPRLKRVVNATGTVLHTNLGRARLARAAIHAVAEAAGESVNLEYDLEQGVRGRREAPIERLLRTLTGAESATVVNNNAAAVLLALNSLATGREVIVSRGELIEIGGSFRIPEIMAKSGAILREVGTTNRTHPEDYARAIGPQTALLLKVHTSNYRVVGFSSEVDLPALVAIGRERNVPVMEDLGSGALVDLGRYGLPKEPVVGERVAMGADVVTFSGDKLLGGPQAGLIVGRRPLIDGIVGNPIHRAVRCGKLTIAGLEATLRLYQESPDVAADIPALAAFTRSISEIEDVGRRALARLRAALGSEFRMTLEESTSQIGSGALPTDEIPTRVVAIRHDRGAGWVAARFRGASVPIIGRIRDDTFLLDLRTIADPEDLVPR
jgi:L-seryl-tRNA(Ser) seleniumtransferase